MYVWVAAALLLPVELYRCVQPLHRASQAVAEPGRGAGGHRVQAALEAAGAAKPRVVHDHGSEFVNRDVAAVIKAHSLIDIKTRRQHPESNGIVERFNGTVRDESDDAYGENYLQAEATIAKLVGHYNDERLHAALGYMTPATWHRGEPEEVRVERARRIAAARAHRKQSISSD